MNSWLSIRNSVPTAARWWLVSLVALLLSCTRTTSTEAGSSESHFLRSCDDDCADGLSCICGVCSEPCESDDGCRSLSPEASCHAQPDALCGEALCDVECQSAQDCTAVLGTGAQCERGRCRAADARADAAVAPPTTCQTQADCDPDERCGYPLADGCDAIGECFLVGADGDFEVYDQCRRPPGLSPGCIVRGSTVRMPDGSTMFTPTHTEEPSAGANRTCDGEVTGPLSCDVRESAESQAVIDASNAADRSCEGDEDCVWANNSSQCFARCGIVLSTAGDAELQAVITELNEEGVCAGFEQDCGPPIIPPCVPPGNAVCEGGQCIESF